MNLTIYPLHPIKQTQNKETTELIYTRKRTLLYHFQQKILIIVINSTCLISRKMPCCGTISLLGGLDITNAASIRRVMAGLQYSMIHAIINPLSPELSELDLKERSVVDQRKLFPATRVACLAGYCVPLCRSF